MQQNPNSKLLIKTFDGSMPQLVIRPKCNQAQVELDIQYYDYDGDGKLKKAKLLFRDVVSIDFEVNYFDNCVGAELFGFYEINRLEKKQEMIEKVFQNRKDGFLLHGNYDYEPDNQHDMLNYRERMSAVYQQLERYHLYQQQTEGGIYYILAGRYDFIREMDTSS